MRVRLCLVAMSVLLTFARTSHAMQQASGDGLRIDFQDTDLRIVLTALAEAAGVNLLYGELPARRVTLRMQQAIPQTQVAALLRSVAESNGLIVVEDGQFIRLVTPADVGRQSPAQRDSTPVPPDRRLYVYRLRHARAPRLSATLQAVFGAGGQGPRADAPIAQTLSSQLRSQEIPRTIASDSAPRVLVEVAPSTKRLDLAAQLHGDLYIVPDEATNSLLIRADPADWAIIEQAILALDLRPLQVLIEVLIVEVQRRKNLDVSTSLQILGLNGADVTKGTLKGRTTGDVVLELLRPGSLSVAGALSILSAHGDTRILSRPVILAQNNEEARILIGSERPFVQVSRTLPTDAGVRDQVIQYRDVGTKLTILPTINNDGYVNLQVVQEVSNATAESQFDAPIISTREAVTRLFVRDGQTAVIGGLVERLQEKTRSGIPVLMDIPLLGMLFGSTRNSTVQNELFLFLTPHILTEDADVDEIRQGLIESTEVIRTMQPLFPLVVPTDSAAAPSPRAGGTP